MDAISNLSITSASTFGRFEPVTARYSRFSFGDRSVLVEPESATGTVLRLLNSGLFKVFSSRDIAPRVGLSTAAVSYILRRLAFRGIIDRTPRPVWLDYPAPEYLYFFRSINWRDELEGYLLAKLRGQPETVSAYYAISSSEEAWSSIEIRERLGADPKSLRSTFVGAGLLSASKEHISAEWYEWFFYQDMWSLQAKQRTALAESLERKKARLSLLRKEAISRGAKLESKLYNAFLGLMQTGELQFRLTAVRKQVKKRIGDRLRIFDVTLEFTPFLGDAPLKYASKKLILVVEAKDTVTGAAVLDRHKLDVDRAYPGQGIPVVATTRPTQSAFDAIRDYPCLILTGKQLDAILERSSGKSNTSERSKCEQSPVQCVEEEQSSSISSRPTAEPRPASYVESVIPRTVRA